LFKFLVVGDVELRTNYPYGSYDPAKKMNSRLSDVLGYLEFVMQTSEIMQCSHVFFLGDLFDCPDPEEDLQRYFIQVVGGFIMNGGTVVVILGNHDQKGFLSNSLSSFQVYPLDMRLHVFSTPTTYKPVESGDVEFDLIPWDDDHGKIYQYLKGLKNVRKYKVVLGHFEVKGATVGPLDHVYTEGIDPEMLAPRDKSIIYKALGHFHSHQKLYIGSLYRIDFGERNDVKLFKYVCIDTKKGEVVDEQLFHTGDRDFIQFDYTPDVDYNKLVEDNKSRINGAVVKVVFSGPREFVRMVDVNAVRSVLYHYQAFKVVTDVDIKDVKEARKTIPMTGLGGVNSAKILKEYCFRFGGDRKAEREKFGMEILSGVSK
jgi:DNA repair exonuclease SbcCD nuclease subunit